MKNRTLKKKGGIFGIPSQGFFKSKTNDKQSPEFGMTQAAIEDQGKPKKIVDYASDAETEPDAATESDVDSDRSSNSSDRLSFGSDSFGNSESISQKSYSWDSFVKRVSNSPFLDSLVSEKVKGARYDKKTLNIVRAQLALLYNIITGDDTLYQTVGAKQAAERVAVTNSLNQSGIIPDDVIPPQDLSIEEHICSKYPEIVKDYPDVSPKTQSLMCAFREIADHFPSIKYTLAEGKNIFHYLALSTIQSKGVGIRSKATSFLSSGFKTETQTKTRDQEIMDTVLQFLCKETTPPNQIFPSRLKQFLQGNAGIQQMLSEQDLYGKTPIRIVTSQNESIAKNSCFINNIKTTQSGGKSRRSRKQNKRALKKSKKSRKTARK